LFVLLLPSLQHFFNLLHPFWGRGGRPADRLGDFSIPCIRSRDVADARPTDAVIFSIPCIRFRDVVDGRPTGAVRVSFGWASAFEDAAAVLSCVRRFFVEASPPPPPPPPPLTAAGPAAGRAHLATAAVGATLQAIWVSADPRFHSGLRVSANVPKGSALYLGFRIHLGFI
jgi:hypothetical protein